MNGFKAMWGKECRQNIKWAILGMLAVALALAIAVGRNLPRNQPNSGMNSGMYFALWDSVTTVYGFAPPLIAMLLGLLQILPEQRRDLWAFLIHRPASRTTLFWGKVAAGLVLYFGATLVPLLAFALWARTPGNIAGPFDWHLLLGALCGILLGIMFYFAALLTALRPARWWGSRALPVPAAIFAAFALGTQAGGTSLPLWLSQGLVLVVTALFCLTAYGAFLTSGLYEPQPRPARAALGIILFVGTTMTFFTLIGLAVASWNVLFPQPSETPVPAPQYGVTWAGQIIRYVRTWSGEIDNVYVMNGEPLRLPAHESFLGNENIINQQNLDPDMVGGEMPNVGSQQFVAAIPLFRGNTHEQWYYVQGTGRFVGYDTLTRTRIAVLHLPASSSDQEDYAQRLLNVQDINPLFPNKSGLFDLIVAFPHHLYRITSATLSVMPLSLPLHKESLTDIQSIQSILAFPRPGSEGRPVVKQTAEYQVAVTKSRFLVLSDRGQYLFSVPAHLSGLPPSEDEVMASVTPDGKDFFFWYDNGLRLREYNVQGVLQKQTNLPVLPSAYGIQSMPLGEGLIGLLIPPPLVPVLAWDAVQHHQWPEWLRLMLLLSALAGFISAFLAWRISLRCADRRAGRWAWTAGVFWLGLLGVLMLLALRGWPARETCPNCRRLRVVTRERCEHCGAPFAPVALDGTEIFGEEDLTAEAAAVG